jgi:hypothetical protein
MLHSEATFICLIIIMAYIMSKRITNDSVHCYINSEVFWV